ncbi:hypothetical protein GF362_04690 [Candidatus Dojkabacteria bacterium]|nr:hypothetical protein [Candidatus Dojkabacteria bacterium]
MNKAIPKVLSDQTDRSFNQIKQKLLKFGLNRDEISVYLFLIQNDLQSALQISRKTRIGRTKVYRLLKNLIGKGLVKEVLASRGKKFQIESLKNLDLILIEKENELAELKTSKQELLKKLEEIKLGSSKSSKTFYYEGPEGLKQITWNSLEAKDEICIFEISEGMHPFTGEEFAEKMRLEIVKRGIVTRQLTNIQHFDPYTNIQAYIDKHHKLRYIDPDDLKMDFELLIYNNVVAIYTYIDEAFGVELHNENLARMQKQLFNFVWKKAQKMKLRKGGRADLQKQ